MLTSVEEWNILEDAPPIGPGEVHLWRARLGTRPEVAEYLSPGEWMRAQRFHFDQDCERFVATRGLVRLILSRYLGMHPAAIAFTVGRHGKPALDASSTTLRFNISHSDDLLLLAVTHAREVGVDLEFMREDLPFETLADHYFDPDEAWELRLLTGQNRAWKFYDVWTSTEAQLKAGGLGLTHGTTVPDRERWSLLKLSPAVGYAAAIAIEGEDIHVECCAWPD